MLPIRLESVYFGSVSHGWKTEESIVKTFWVNTFKSNSISQDIRKHGSGKNLTADIRIIY